MGLAKYHSKRDFNKTSEPKGRKTAASQALQFVVQKHQASHLHYDFRLEIDGVLVSWAVPKGPSYDSAQKRLAVHVEDHPMDYLRFEGNIPKDAYGGGTVMVWDIGTYTPEGNPESLKEGTVMRKQLEAGSIKIILKGNKLKGAWHLVKMKNENDQWLLLKAKDGLEGKSRKVTQSSAISQRSMPQIAKDNKVWKDGQSQTDTPNPKTAAKVKNNAPKKVVSKTEDPLEFSTDALEMAKKTNGFPKDFKPQMATLTEAAFDDPNWIFEHKYDGYRALAMIHSGKVELQSRNQLSFTKAYPEIIETLSKLQDDLILDGEIVVEDGKGKSHFQWLQNLDENPQRGKLKYYVFDLLYYNKFDLRPLPLLERKKILQALLPKWPNVIYASHEIENGLKAYKTAERQKGEGIIAKRADASYQSGKRNKDWLKIKTSQSQEMVIGGFTDPAGSRKGIGALLCGYYQDGKLLYAGKVGSGFSDAVLRELRGKLDKLARKTCPFEETPGEKNAHWVTPSLVAALKFSEFTENQHMRHPVFEGLRTDKKAKDVKLEAQASAGTPKSNKEQSDESKSHGGASQEPKSQKVTFSNLDKLYFPKLKISKGDVIAYYEQVSSYILPYLIDRPQSLRRNPDGIDSDGFFQKNVAGMVPKWIKTRQIKSNSKEEPITYLLCQDRETLLFLANYGCIELNPWSSRVGSLHNPDYIIFDLDPKDAPFKNLIATALKLKEILDALEVPAFLKTSGGNGLHVFIPVLPKYTYNQTREFSHLVSQMVHRELPKITSLERMPAKRKGKIYLDFLQNGKGKTMASIYALRPRENAGVSTPLEWDELSKLKRLDDFNFFTILDRLRQKGDLWENIFKSAIDLKSILQKLES